MGGAYTGGEGLRAAWPTRPLRLHRGPRRGGNRVGVAGGQGEEGSGGRQWEGGGRASSVRTEGLGVRGGEASPPNSRLMEAGTGLPR